MLGSDGLLKVDMIVEVLSDGKADRADLVWKNINL